MVRVEGLGLGRMVERDDVGARVAEGVKGEEGEAAGSLQAEGAVRAGGPGVHIPGQGGLDLGVVGGGEVHGLRHLQ
jgi:hypothetical protein